MHSSLPGGHLQTDRVQSTHGLGVILFQIVSSKEMKCSGHSVPTHLFAMCVVCAPLHLLRKRV